jgi:hypothetical protein
MTRNYYYVLILPVLVFGFTVTGCGKTISELRADGGAIVDNGGSIIKKVLDAGVAVYDLGKKLIEDSQDNVHAVKDVVAPTEPTK